MLSSVPPSLSPSTKPFSPGKKAKSLTYLCIRARVRNDIVCKRVIRRFPLMTASLQPTGVLLLPLSPSACTGRIDLLNGICDWHVMWALLSFNRVRRTTQKPNTIVVALFARRPGRSGRVGSTPGGSSRQWTRARTEETNSRPRFAPNAAHASFRFDFDFRISLSTACLPRIVQIRITIETKTGFHVGRPFPLSTSQPLYFRYRTSSYTCGPSSVAVRR